MSFDSCLKSKLYLLDANVFIELSATYYGMKRVREFWFWIIDLAKRDIVKIPHVIWEELTCSPH